MEIQLNSTNIENNSQCFSKLSYQEDWKGNSYNSVIYSSIKQIAMDSEFYFINVFYTCHRYDFIF